ncbi:MAG: hypothetical protein ACKPKO_24205, partial [Candidatus Fonsibacter sp.]
SGIYVGTLYGLQVLIHLLNFWAPVYVDQGIIVQNGLLIGMYDVGSPYQFAQTAIITQTGDITTQRHYYMSR